MTIFEALKIARQSGLPETEAHLLIQYIVNKRKEFIIMNPDYEIDEERFLSLLKKRLDGYPIHYIIKGKEFYKNWFYVEEGVLIPRHETEILVETAIEYIKEYKLKIVCEIGVGSGAVIISILLETNTIGFGTDISEKALEITKINAKRLGVYEKLLLRKGPYLYPFNELYEKIDLIVSNPPYVKKNARLPKELYWEPREALFAGEDGLDFYKEFLKLYDLSGKIVILEIGHDQGDFFRQLGWNVKKDLSGNDRIAVFDGWR
ncbi:MAG: peptide chain release factor N(5)-glutamine methyltransferase [Thermosipho sp. (in: Bacteria)]|nr:peptide chain release factor N(5)-glutamine methyltransferase [Thermosipho sp. (in: thermotogales)]